MAKERTNRIWDFLVLWPFIYFALLIILIPMFAIFTNQTNFGNFQALLIGLTGILFLVHIATVVEMIVLYIYAIHRLYTKTKLPDDKKKMWLILIVIFNIFAIPFLHFVHLRK